VEVNRRRLRRLPVLAVRAHQLPTVPAIHRCRGFCLRTDC
jgi:hypothetical protein